jgi:hypothetical protein
LKAEPLEATPLQIREAWLIDSENAASDELIKVTEESDNFACKALFHRGNGIRKSHTPKF